MPVMKDIERRLHDKKPKRVGVVTGIPAGAAAAVAAWTLISVALGGVGPLYDRHGTGDEAQPT